MPSQSGNPPSLYVCYVDESGTEVYGDTSHFVLLGLSVPTDNWKVWDAAISSCKQPYGLEHEEVHTAWVARRYPEQEKIANFSSLSWDDRRKTVETSRQMHLMKLTAQGRTQALKSARKNYKKSAPYIHLTYSERMELLRSMADTVGQWSDARLFAEAIDKDFHRREGVQTPIMELAFTEMVQRFEYYLRHRGNFMNCRLTGILVQDHNETASKRLTQMMTRFHREGTRWTDINHIIETPMFVDSSLTAMVQVSDLCAYATRRFFENKERMLFDRIYARFDRAGSAVVGIRHFTVSTCNCHVCQDHRARSKSQQSLPIDT